MKSVLKNIIVLISLTSAFFVGCADIDTPQHQVSLFQSMDSWMKANKPNIPMIDSGLYYQIYDKNGTPISDENGDIDNGDETPLTPGDSSIVEVLINGEALDGNKFLNSNDTVARQLGNFRWTTRYVPFRYTVGLYSQYNFTNIGVNSIIKKMRAGDSAVIYLSPNNSYGYIDAQITQYSGFEGSIHYTNGIIGEFNVALKKIEPSPLDTVLEQTEQYALNVLGMKKIDTIRKGLYVLRMDSIGGGEFLGDKDTTIQLKYKGYFFDGFVFDTNIEEEAKEHNIYNAAIDYGTTPYTNAREDSDASSGFIDAWEYAIRKLKPGDKATILTIPEWAYGVNGEYNTVRNINGTMVYGAIIPGITPLIFDIEIVIPD